VFKLATYPGSAGIAGIGSCRLKLAAFTSICINTTASKHTNTPDLSGSILQQAAASVAAAMQADPSLTIRPGFDPGWGLLFVSYVHAVPCLWHLLLIARS
jgi:hypothetical protein